MLAARKSLANEHKRSSGKRVMMRRLGLLAERKAEEAVLIDAVPEAAVILARLAEIYSVFRAMAPLAAALQKMQVRFYAKNDGFYAKNDGFYTESGGLPRKCAALCRPYAQRSEDGGECCILKIMSLVFGMMNFVFNVMNFVLRGEKPDSEREGKNTNIT